MAILIRMAAGAADIVQVRGLMREYGAHLATNLASHPAGPANICLVGYEEELAGLPEPYGPPGGLLLAEVDGIAAGCVALKRLRPAGVAPDGGGLALEVKRLWVGPEFRQQRLGRRLMEAAVEHARAAQAKAIYLDTVPAAMPEANRMYAAMGFVPVERYNENPVADVVFYRLTLG